MIQLVVHLGIFEEQISHQILLTKNADLYQVRFEPRFYLVFYTNFDLMNLTVLLGVFNNTCTFTCFSPAASLVSVP